MRDHQTGDEFHQMVPYHLQFKSPAGSVETMLTYPGKTSDQSGQRF